MATPALPPRLVRRSFAVLARLFPARTRQRFGGELARAMADAWRDERPALGRMAAARLWLRLAGDLARAGVQARADQRRRRRVAAVPEVHRRFAMDALRHDFSLALRNLSRAPGFSLVAVLVLALGLGAAVTVFSVIDGVLLRPLPFPRADRLVMIWDVPTSNPSARVVVSPANVADWRADARSFEAIAAFNLSRMIVPSGDGRIAVPGAVVTANYFAVLGVEPQLGRALLPGDEGPGRAPVVVLSDGFWRRHFGGDPAVIGRPLTGVTRSPLVVGVMPPGFQGPDEAFFGRADFWAPVNFDLGSVGRGGRWFRTVARLAAGVTVDQAASEMRAIAARLEQAYPDGNSGWSATVVSLHEQITGRVRPMLLVLLGAVGVVLLVVCANLASLLLSRGLSRSREFAIRAALGARRARIVQAVAAESLVLAIAGAALGLLAASWVTRAVAALATNLPRAEGVAVNGTVVAFGLGLAVVTSLAFGVMPGLSATRIDLLRSLRDAGRTGSEGRGPRRARRALVVAEVALSLLLLVGAGLLTRSFFHLLRTDTGFDPASLVVARVDLPADPGSSAGSRVTLLDRLEERLAATPSLRRAGFVTSLPFYGLNNVGFMVTVPGHEETASQWAVRYRAVTPGYLGALGVRLRAGRLIDRTDIAGAPGAVVVNDAFVDRLLGGAEPIGQRVGFSFGGGDFTGAIVGVVAGVRHDGLRSDVEPEMYVPYAQSPVLNPVFLAARVEGSPAAFAPQVRDILAGVEPRLVIEDVQPMRSLVARDAQAEWLSMAIFLAFAGLTLVLAAVGLYAVLAHAVGQRVREIGIRMALGADPSAVRALVLRDGLRVVLAGVGLGLAAAVASTRVLAGMLYGVTATDPTTFVAVSLVLVGVAALSAFVPARRAGRVDPIVSLRVE